MKVLFLLMITLLATSHANAAIYYVSPTGQDSYSCVEAQNTETPKRTVASAKGCVTAGDTIQMRGGTYTESQVIWYNGPSGTSWIAPITLENYPGEQPVWNMPSDTQIQLYFWNVAYIIVRGITFDGTNGSNSLMPDQTSTPVGGGYNFIIIDCSQSASSGCAHHLRIENNEMRNTAYGAITVAMGANNVEIRNNYIHQIGKVSNSNVIYLAGHTNLVEDNVIEYTTGSIAAWSNNCCGYTDNNVFRGNKVTRIGWFWALDNGTDELGSHTQNTPNPRSPAFFVSRGTNIQVYDNIIIDSPGGVAVRYGAADCEVHANVIYGNTNNVSNGYAGIQFDDNTSNCLVSNNIISGQGSNPAIQNNAPGGGGHRFDRNVHD